MIFRCVRKSLSYLKNINNDKYIYQRRRDKEQAERVARNKREFVLRMLPIVDSFRSARSVAPPTTEKEENMHKSFESLLIGILNVFQKYGYKEFTPGTSLDYLSLPFCFDIIKSKSILTYLNSSYLCYNIYTVFLKYLYIYDYIILRIRELYHSYQYN